MREKKGQEKKERKGRERKNSKQKEPNETKAGLHQNQTAFPNLLNITHRDVTLCALFLREPLMNL